MAQSSYPARMATTGREKITGLSSVKTLTVPLNTTMALLNPVTKGISFTSDGTTPSASVGIQLAAGALHEFQGDLDNFKAIELAASAVLNVEYYGHFA